MHQNDALRAKAGGKHNAGRKFFKAPAQDLFRRTALQRRADLLEGFGRPYAALVAGLCGHEDDSWEEMEKSSAGSSCVSSPSLNQWICSRNRTTSPMINNPGGWIEWAFSVISASVPVTTIWFGVVPCSMTAAGV